MSHAEQAEAALEGLDDLMVAVRRDLHAHPELSWAEERSTTAVAGHLAAAGLEPVRFEGATGLTCDLGSGDGPTVVLRADLDALPIDDEKDTPYRSVHPGVSHACGHDVHTATVLGAGLALQRLAQAGQLPGRVRLLFQPAEEVLPGGALFALASGALEGVGRVFALHCDPRVEAGSVALRSGPITAATDALTVRLRGPGGHTARPHLTVDLVAALAEVVARTPALLSRRVDPRASMSLVWGTLSAGTAANVIPELAMATGSLRVLDPVAWEAAAELVPELVRQVAAPFGADVEVDYVRGVPPAVNDAAATTSFRDAAVGVLSADHVAEAEQSMGGEDVAWLLEKVPGTLARLGVRPRGQLRAPDLHRGDFDVDETALACGARVLVAGVLGALADPSLR